MASLALHLLGSPRLELDGVPITLNRRKVLALLVYLTLTQRPHRRDHLAALFWPDYDQSSARSNLRRTLSTPNKTLDGDWLHIDGEQVSLKRDDNFWLDVDQFHQHLTSCTAHGHSGSQVCADCLEPLSQAAALYQDDLLTGFSLAETLEKLVRGHRAQGEFDPAIEFARRWLALDPLQEPAHRQLMRLLTLSSRIGRAEQPQ